MIRPAFSPIFICPIGASASVVFYFWYGLSDESLIEAGGVWKGSLNYKTSESRFDNIAAAGAQFGFVPVPIESKICSVRQTFILGLRVSFEIWYQRGCA